jgi:uncharacterized protein YuzE
MPHGFMADATILLSPMEASYDPEVDAAYVRIRPFRGPVRTKVALDGTVIDHDDETGEVIGYELLRVGLRGLDAFQTVPEAGRLLVSRAIDRARVEHRGTQVTDSGRLTVVNTLRVMSLPVGAAVGLWTAQLYAPLRGCPGNLHCPAMVGSPAFATWQCALFGAGAAALVLIVSVLVAFRRLPSKSLLVGILALVACAPTPVTRHSLAPATSTPTPVSWVHADYHGDLLVVTLTYPADWRSQLEPLSLHYYAIFGFLANFPLPQYWQRTSESLSCSWSAIRTFPLGGMLVTFGAEVAGGPAGVSPGGSILDRGTRTSIDGRRAAEESGQAPESTPGYCPAGADHWLTYAVDASQRAIFDIRFFWRGADPALANDAQTVGAHLTLRPDPSYSGPFPS